VVADLLEKGWAVYPPEARLEYSYDPFIGTAKGRTFKIGTKVRF